MDSLKVFGSDKPMTRRNFDSALLREDEKLEEEKRKSDGNRFEQLKIKPKRRDIGSYDKEMFKDLEPTRRNNLENVVNIKADYNKILKEHRNKSLQETEDSKGNNLTNRLKVFNDFDSSKIVRKEERPQKEPRQIMRGIGISEKVIRYGYGKSKRIDVLNITNITSLKANKSKLTGFIEGYDCAISLLGFNSRFEMFLAIECERPPLSDGTGRLVKTKTKYLLAFEVEYFDKNEPIIVTINKRKFRFAFKETNKLIQGNLSENIFSVVNVSIKEY